MERADAADAYLNEVLAHVRWKKAHGAIRQELCDHIEDARLGFLARGMDDGEAQKKAVAEMGNAADVGARFDKAYRPAKNYGVWIPFAALYLLGTLLCAIAVGSEAFSFSTFFFPFVFAAACFFPLGRLARHGLPLYGLFLAVFTGWALIAYFSHEPSPYHLKYLALFFPLVYALLIYRMRGRGPRAILLLGVFFAIQVALSSFIFFYERAWILSLFLACLAELLCAALSGWFSRNRYWGALLILVPTLLFIVAYLNAAPLLADPNFFENFSASYMYDTGYLRELLASVRWFGAADTAALSEGGRAFLFGNLSIDAMRLCFFAWLAGRFGLLASLSAAALFLSFFAFALKACFRQKSVLYRTASLGIILHFLFGFSVQALASFGLIPALGLLPFLSVNGISLLFDAALAGLLFSMLYNGSLADDEAVKRLPRWRLKFVKETE
ncbi:MAG: permease prefix domain 1-containing protein [Clostridiaceae bacterium]|nr:permease prefix domain 1-containing protein [Eubacteriales bacterium]